MAGKRKAPPAKPLASLAREHGVSRETLRAWRDSGVDIQDAAALAARIAVMPGKSNDETLLEAKRRRAVADADRAEILAAREAGKVIELAEAEQVMAKIGAEVRARLLAWRGTLVPELFGLDEPGIHRVLTDRIHELLEMISSNNPAAHE